MANKEVINIEVPSGAINSFKELKTAIKEATNAQVQAMEKFGASSAEYKKASKDVANLKDKVEDLTDASKSLKGSGIERSAQGFSQLGEGLRNLDFDKVKVGLTAIKSALAATGVMLLVQGVMYLIENFEELSQGSGLLAKSLRVVGDVIQGAIDLIYKFTDAIGLSNSELDKQGEAIVTNAQATSEALNQQTKDFDRQMAVAKAAGKSTIELEQAKQQAIIDTNVQIVKQIEAFVRAGGELDEQQRKQLTASLETIKDARTQQKVVEITHNKEVNDNYKKHLEEKKALDDKALDEYFNNALAEQLQDERIRKDLEKFKEAEDKKAKLKLDKEAELRDTLESQMIADIEKSDKEHRDSVKKKKEQELSAMNDVANAAKMNAESQANLANFLFDLKRKNAVKGSAEDLKLAKRQFQLNKALAIQTSIISGIQGVINALSAQSVIPEPYGTILKVANAVGVGIAATINTAKIASQQFNEGGGGGGDASASVGGVGSTATAAPPTLSNTQNTPPSTTAFDDKGKNLTPVVKAQVVETEIKDASNRVTRLENQATF